MGDIDTSVLYGSDWFKQRPPKIQQAFRDFPPWGFYQNKATGQPARLWGFRETKTGITANCAVLSMGFVHEILGGLPIEDLEQVAQWDDWQKVLIGLLPEESQGVFLEPFGFAALYEDKDPAD